MFDKALPSLGGSFCGALLERKIWAISSSSTSRSPPPVTNRLLVALLPIRSDDGEDAVFFILDISRLVNA